MSTEFSLNLGQAAGKIWTQLNESETPISATRLSESTGLDKNQVQRALGWLAREGKIVVELKGKNEFFSLNHG